MPSDTEGCTPCHCEGTCTCQELYLWTGPRNSLGAVPGVVSLHTSLGIYLQAAVSSKHKLILKEY